MDVRNNFLFIDTENCNQVKNNLYGWCIFPANKGNKEMFLNRHDLFQETYDGSYVIVQNFPEKIAVCQDSIGSHGLYLYRLDGYFAISNSFLFLLEKLSYSHHHLTINQDYIDSFMLNGYTMESCGSTPVLEIQELPRNITVQIDKKKKNVYFHEKILKDRSVDICSEEGMKIVDSWYGKWTSIIRKLQKDGADISVDLSGGFDSRINFMLAAGAGVDWNKININTYLSKEHTFEEDYVIAQNIAKHYGIKLNANKENRSNIPISPHDSLAWSFYIRLGFHKQLQFQLNRYKRPVYHFTGIGGEMIRHFQAATREQYIDNYNALQKGMRIGYDFMPGFVKTLDRSEQVIKQMYSNYLSEDIGGLLYNEGGARHHHGKEMIEAFESNELRIGPCLDSQLQMICYAKEYPYLLNAVLLMRFEPELLNFEFNNCHTIPEQTLKEAKRINDMFPKSGDVSCGEEHIFMINELPFNDDNDKVSIQGLDHKCCKIYESGFVKGNMGKLYPARVYEHAKLYYNTHDHYPMEEMWAAIAIAYCVYLVELSSTNEEKDSVKVLMEKKDVYDKEVEDYMSRWPVPEYRLFPDCRIILYGAGNMGNAFYKQIKKRGLGKVSLWVDKNPDGKDEKVQSISALNHAPNYDVLIVAIESRKLQKEVLNLLKKIDFPGYDENKIILA